MLHASLRVCNWLASAHRATFVCALEGIAPRVWPCLPGIYRPFAQSLSLVPSIRLCAVTVHRAKEGRGCQYWTLLDPDLGPKFLPLLAWPLLALPLQLILPSRLHFMQAPPLTVPLQGPSPPTWTPGSHALLRLLGAPRTRIPRRALTAAAAQATAWPAALGAETPRAPCAPRGLCGARRKIRSCQPRTAGSLD